MTTVKTPMSISALLNPQQQSDGDRNGNERQIFDLLLRHMQIHDSNSTSSQSYQSDRLRHEQNEQLQQLAARDQPFSDDNKKLLPQDQQQKGPAGYRYERFNSVSSTSSTTVSERRRAPRPKYTDEEMYFIWYHRVDLNKEWRDCTDAFNKQFPGQGRSERNTQGIQCKFYRFINAQKCPTVREQRRLKDGEFMARGRPSRERMPKFGVIEWCHVWYPWMRKSHALPGLQPGPQLNPAEPNGSGSSSSGSSRNSSNSNSDRSNGRNTDAVGDDKRMMRTYSHSSISSASILSSETSTPEPCTPSSYSDEIVSEETLQ